MPFNAASICVKSAGLLRTVGFAQDQALFGGCQVLFAKLPHGHRLAAIEAFVCWIFATCHLAESGESKSARLLGCYHSMPADRHATAHLLRIAIVDEVGACAGGVNEHSEALQLAAPDRELGFARLGGVDNGLCQFRHGPALRKTHQKLTTTEQAVA